MSSRPKPWRRLVSRLATPWGRDRTCKFCRAAAGSGSSVSRAFIAPASPPVFSSSARPGRSTPRRWATPARALHHMHTDERLTITYKMNGRFDDAALKKINWILRDWRKEQAIAMDPEEIDLLWEVYQEVGAKEPIQIICGYRSPDTNEMLRHRSNGVASSRSTRSARRSTSTFPACRSMSSAPPRCACRAAASASIRPPARPSCMSMSATSALGRACHASSSSSCSPMAARCICRPTARRFPATSLRRPTSSAAIAPWPNRRRAASWLRCSAATRIPKRPATTPSARDTAAAPRSVTAKAEPANLSGPLSLASRSAASSSPPPPPSPPCPAAAGADAAAAAGLSGRRCRKPPGATGPAAGCAVRARFAVAERIVNMRGLWDSPADAALRRRRSPKPTRLSVSSARRTPAAAQPRSDRQHRPVPDPRPRAGRYGARLRRPGRWRHAAPVKTADALPPWSPPGVRPRSPSKPSGNDCREPHDAGRRAPRRSVAARPRAGAERAGLAGRHPGRRSGFRQPHAVHDQAGLIA